MTIKLIDDLKSQYSNLIIGLTGDDKKRPRLKNLTAQPLFAKLAKNDQEYLLKSLENQKTWTEKSQLILPLPSKPSRTVIFLGLVEKAKQKLSRRFISIRRIIAASKANRLDSIVLSLADFQPTEWSPADFLRQAVINLMMSDFVFNQYKETPKEGWPEIKEVAIFLPKANKETERALQEGIIIGQEINHCRILANTPGGEMTPTKLAQAALDEKKKTDDKLKVTILKEKEIEKLGMGGVLGVSRGSAEKPRFIILEYQGAAKSDRPLVFVGKAVTFDTGGLNLKPEAGIAEMHLDMAGGAAVIHAISAIAQIKLPINIIGLVPAVENMLSGSSYRPGDILRAITGKTIEVLNTDAEGRIILADGLGYGQKFKPQLIADLATLTGAAVVALGQRAIALFATSEELETTARQIGQNSGDVVWPMPLWDEYLEELEGTFGDLANVGKNRYGGAITGAIFLKQFVGDYPWIHLDIAPTMTAIDGQFLAKGASGTGVRFLVDLARYFSNIK